MESESGILLFELDGLSILRTKAITGQVTYSVYRKGKTDLEFVEHLDSSGNAGQLLYGLIRTLLDDSDLPTGDAPK